MQLKNTKKIKNRLKIFAALTAILIAGVVFCCSKKEPVKELSVVDLSEDISVSEEEIPSGNSEAQTAQEDIWVYVCGEVNDPGVYCLPSGSRVFEAVDMAGGFTPEAFSESMNLAWILSDGQTVMVPDSSDVSSAVEGSLADPASQPDSGLIDLNRASLSELMTLPGIGSIKAQAIIDYREQHAFTTIEDIMNVSGIKENSFEKLRDLITVS